MNFVMTAVLVSVSVGTLLCGSLIVRGFENPSFCQESSNGQAEFLNPIENHDMI